MQGKGSRSKSTLRLRRLEDETTLGTMRGHGPLQQGADLQGGEKSHATVRKGRGSGKSGGQSAALRSTGSLT